MANTYNAPTSTTHKVEALSGLAKFKEVIEKDEFAIFDFWATWCGPCRVMAPIYDKLAAQHGDKVKFYKIDHDAEDDIVHELGIRGLPSFYLFRGGKVYGTVIGARPPQLQELIAKAAAYVDEPAGSAAAEVKAAATTPQPPLNAATTPEKAAPAPATTESPAPAPTTTA